MKIQCQRCGSEIEVQIINTSEAANICGVSIYAIFKAIERKLFDAVKIGGPRGPWAMLKSEAERYKRERRSPGRPKRKPTAPAGGLNRPKKERGDG